MPSSRSGGMAHPLNGSGVARVAWLRTGRAAYTAVAVLLIVVGTLLAIVYLSNRQVDRTYDTRSIYLTLSENRYALDGVPIAVSGRVTSTNRTDANGLVYALMIRMKDYDEHRVYIQFLGLDEKHPPVGSLVRVRGRGGYQNLEGFLSLLMWGRDSDVVTLPSDQASGR